MPKLEEDLIDRLTLHPEVREKARALLRTLRSKTGPGTGYDIGDAKSGLPAICTYLASKSAGYADVTQDIAQKASCLAPKTFTGTLKTVKAALIPSNKTPNGTPSKPGGVIDPTAYATLISEHDIGQPRRVERWMYEAQAALLALPRFREDYASRLTESSAEVRIVVFCWVCQTIGLAQLPTAQHIPLADKYGVPIKVFKRLLRMMEDDCEDLKESIHATIKKLREKLAKVEASGAAAASSASKNTPTSTPSQSRSASPTKSAMRGTNLTPSSALTNSAKKRKVAFSLSDVVSASEDDEGVFALPETPSKKKRPHRASASAARVMPVSKAVLASATSSSSEDERAAPAEEDIEMSDAAIPTTPRARPRPRPATASTSGTPPVAGPSTPRRPVATPTHAYRTPPSARIQLRFSDDEDEAATVGDDAEDAEASEDDTLPPSRRFRPVFLDRMQWAQRAPRLAHDRAAAERRTKELVGRWGYPFELLRRASAKPPAG